MTKIVCISDTHNQHHRLTIPECDILIHAGDHCGHGDNYESTDFMTWFASLDQAAHKIFIAGNHDYPFQGNPLMGEKNLVKRSIPSNLIYLEDSYCLVEGLKIYGTPWTPYFYDWAFNGLEFSQGKDNTYKGGPGESACPDADHPLLERVYGKIPDDTDVLICHGPPKNILDRTLQGDNVGSIKLLNRIHQLSNLKIMICGHLHESQGHVKVGNVDYYSVASLNREYKLWTDRLPYTIIEID